MLMCVVTGVEGTPRVGAVRGRVEGFVEGEFDGGTEDGEVAANTAADFFVVGHTIPDRRGGVEACRSADVVVEERR